MVIATHQPIFLPWSGFFAKAVQTDMMILLDDVQFPIGRSWLTRNRLKSDKGELWVAVPVWRKARGKQIIREVEICNERHWRNKHIRSIQEQYANAPYLKDFLSALDSIYARDHRRLLDLNLDLIRFLWQSIGMKANLILQSELGVSGTGTDLLISMCNTICPRSISFSIAAPKHWRFFPVLVNSIFDKDGLRSNPNR